MCICAICVCVTASFIVDLQLVLILKNSSQRFGQGNIGVVGQLPLNVERVDLLDEGLEEIRVLHHTHHRALQYSELQCGAVWCSALQCVAVRCSALQCVVVRCSALQCVAVHSSALQCVAVRRSVVY